MPIPYAELEKFYEGLVVKLRERGVTCAITSGMACVHYGLSQSTKDCDMLCASEAADRYLALLTETVLDGSLPSYRGNISPPLDARWLRGGWTSHFLWPAGGSEVHLDIFGLAPRGSTAWEMELNGLHAGLHTVAEMKRTNRDKDWPFATGLGAKMLKEGDARGWLHLYHEDLLLQVVDDYPCPPEMIQRRPVLQLALQRDPLLGPALYAERYFWHELDRVRLRIYERAVRPYLVAVRKTQMPDGLPLVEQHKIRVNCAEQHLQINPLSGCSVETMVAEARVELAKLIKESLFAWLPDVRENFTSLMK